MKKNLFISFFLLFVLTYNLRAQTLPTAEKTLKVMILINNHFMEKYADCTQPSNVGGVKRPSNIWTRSVYYEGLMSLYNIHHDKRYYDYAVQWGNFHKWGFNKGAMTRNADNQCAAQTYCDIYNICKDTAKIHGTMACANMLVNSTKVDDWTWIDAIQMAMPFLAKVGTITGNKKYYDKMWEMYSWTRDTLAGGLFNKEECLWWRDKDFVPPYKEPNGENCYWSRGNGWVYAALVRVMDNTPKTEQHRKDYENDFISMSKAIKACQRKDGFWNCSLHDATHFGGKETSGTSLFVYGMAWGIRKGLLPRKEYLPVVAKAWNAILKDAVHPDGVIGFIQGTGKEPKDSQPVTYDKIPDFEDFGTGCLLLAGSEVYKL